MDRRRRGGGFTLLEVLVALALLAVALIPLMQTFGQSLRLAASARMLTQATLLARDAMARLELEAFPDLGETGGDFAERAEGYRWARAVLPPPAGLDPETVREVRFVVLWEEGTALRRYELVDFVVRK